MDEYPMNHSHCEFEPEMCAEYEDPDQDDDDGEEDDEEEVA